MRKLIKILCICLFSGFFCTLGFLFWREGHMEYKTIRMKTEQADKHPIVWEKTSIHKVTPGRYEVSISWEADGEPVYLGCSPLAHKTTLIANDRFVSLHCILIYSEEELYLEGGGPLNHRTLKPNMKIERIQNDDTGRNDGFDQKPE